MHTFERRSPAERARHINALRERSSGFLGEAGGFIKRQLARAVLPLPSPTTTPAAKKTVTTTVVVKATAPPTTTNPLQIPKVVSPPTTTHTTSPLLPLDPIPTVSPTSVVPTTPPAAIPVVPTSSPPPAIPTTTPPTSFAPLTTSTPLPTSTGTPGSGIGSSTAKSKGISPAATVAIVALCVIAVLAVGIFGVRKVYMRRRERRRNTWGAGMFPAFPEKFENTPTQETAQAVAEKPPSPGPSSIASGNGFGAALATRDAPNQTFNSNVPYYVTPAPPPMSYNNPIMDDVYGGLAAPGPSEAAKVARQSTGSTAAGAAAGGAVETAVVRVVFIPSLPDELSISVGEVVRVVKAFDDGWALCTNMRGEQGVVPLECLDRTPQNTSSGGYGQSAAVDARRLSSLSTQAARY